MLKEKGFETRPVLGIHDELVFRIPDKEKVAVDHEIKEVMKTAPNGFDIPLEVDCSHSKSWGDK
jgi:DNA polymerase I-like protein with 3'-5' exonuclease and polymerase domains